MKKYSQYFLFSLCAIAGALLFLNLFARVDFRLEALQANLSIRTAAGGYTVLRIPPIGEVKASTHKTPVIINIALENIDLDRLKKILAEGTEEAELAGEARNVLTATVKRFIYYTLALSFAGGVFGVLVCQRRRIKELTAGGLIGLAAVSIILFWTYYTFDIKKFENPEYEGMIKAAPWMIGLAQESLATVNTWSEQMKGIAANLNGLFQRVESLQAVTAGDGEIKVLHVSDIHNNPASFEFINQVVKAFGIDLVIDSGDMSDFGTPLEAALLERVKTLEVPYVITPGNHETPSIIQELKKTPNVKVVEAGLLDVKGLKIAGIADPASFTFDSTPPDAVKLEEFAARLEETIRGAGSVPDILVAHNPKIAEKFWGKIPVVLTGHEHRYRIEVKNKSVFINAGTSGASGIGALKTNQEIPYSFVVLHFDRNGSEGVRLKYTDTIRISNLQSGYSMERRVYPELYNGAPEI